MIIDAPIAAANSRRRLALQLLLTGSLLLPTPAFAAWESIRLAPAANQVDGCSGDHKNNARLLASQARPLRVITGARAMLEIFGQGIDLARTVTLENAPAGVSAVYQGGTGGAANLARRCGAIGSVKLQLDVAPVPAGRRVPTEQNFTLRIGNERVPVVVRMPADFRLAWNGASARDGSEPLSPQRQAPAAAPPPPPPQANPPRQPSPECLTGTTNCIVYQSNGIGGSPSSSDSFKLRTLASCIIGRGGDARQLGSRLEIMLPDNRAGTAECFSRFSFTNTAQFLVGDVDIGVGRSDWAPGIVYTIAGGPEASVSTAPEDGETARVLLDRNFAATMIGSREFRLIGTNYAGTARTLELLVRSVVPYGVTGVSVASGLANTGGLTAGRFNPGQPGAQPAAAPAISFDVQLAATSETNRPLRWQVMDANGRPLQPGNSCFAAREGTELPAAGASRVSISVPRASAGACAGQGYALWVAPSARMGDAFYTKTTPFTLR